MLRPHSDENPEARGHAAGPAATLPAFEPDYYARTLDELRRVLFQMNDSVTLTRDDLLAILLLSDTSDAVVWWLIDRCAAVAS